MAQPFRRDRLTILTYGLLAFYSYYINGFGPITPFLKDELSLSYTVSSLHYTAFAAGILGAGLGGPALVRRIGRVPALWTGAGGLSLGAVLLVLGRTPFLTIGASFVMGLIGSLILAIVPGALSDRHGEQRAIAVSEANVISSMTGAAVPLMVGLAARALGEWRWALGIAAVAPLLLWVVLGRGDLSGTDATVPGEGSKRGRSLPLRYWTHWASLVLAISVEFCMILWSADYLENVLGIEKASAAQAVSLFLAAMIVGRWAGSRLVRRIPAQRLVFATILVAGVAFLAFWQSRSPLVGLGALFLTGLGVANLYPLILSLAIASAKEKTVEASGRATLASGAAIMTLPLVMGRVADAAGIQLAFGVVLALLAGLFLVNWVAGNDRFWPTAAR